MTLRLRNLRNAASSSSENSKTWFAKNLLVVCVGVWPQLTKQKEVPSVSRFHGKLRGLFIASRRFVEWAAAVGWSDVFRDGRVDFGEVLEH